MYFIRYQKYIPSYIYKPVESSNIADYIICNSEFSKKNQLNDLIYIKTVNLNFYLEKGQYICGDTALQIMDNPHYYKTNIYTTNNTFNNTLLYLAKKCEFIETKMYIYVFNFSNEFKNYMFRHGYKIKHLMSLKIYKNSFKSKIDILQQFELDSYRILITRKGKVYTTVNGYFAFLKKINIINIFNDSNKLLDRIIKHESYGYKAVHFYAQNSDIKTLPKIDINRILDMNNPEIVILINLFNMISGNFGKLFCVNGLIYNKKEFIETFKINLKRFDWQNFLFNDTNAHNFNIYDLIIHKINSMYPYYCTLHTNRYCKIPVINKLQDIYVNPIKHDLLHRNTEIMYIYIGLKQKGICKPLIWNILAFYFKKKISSKYGF